MQFIFCETSKLTYFQSYVSCTASSYLNSDEPVDGYSLYACAEPFEVNTANNIVFCPSGQPQTYPSTQITELDHSLNILLSDGFLAGSSYLKAEISSKTVSEYIAETTNQQPTSDGQVIVNCPEYTKLDIDSINGEVIGIVFGGALLLWAVGLGIGLVINMLRKTKV